MSQANTAYRTALLELQSEQFARIQAIERPVQLSLPPGAPNTPEIHEYIKRVEDQLNAQVKDPNSEFNQRLAQACFEEMP